MPDRESEIRSLIQRRFAAAGLDTSRAIIDRALAEMRETGKLVITLDKYPPAPDPTGPQPLTAIGDIGLEGISQAFDALETVRTWLPGESTDFFGGSVSVRARRSRGVRRRSEAA